MGSSRLPGKILMPLAGKPALFHVVDRLGYAKLLDKIVVATTNEKADDQVEDFCKKNHFFCFRGSEDDVLDRYFQSAKEYNADIIIRITGDCPLADPALVDEVVQYFLDNDFDYVSNTIKPTYPDGLDTEVFSFESLEKAWKEADLKSEREHVTPYIWKNPDKFKIANVQNDVDLSYLRWTVDKKEDMELVQQIYKHLYKEGYIFYMKDILELLEKYPDLKLINQGISSNEGYTKSLKEDKIVR